MQFALPETVTVKDLRPSDIIIGWDNFLLRVMSVSYEHGIVSLKVREVMFGPAEPAHLVQYPADVRAQVVIRGADLFRVS